MTGDLYNFLKGIDDYDNPSSHCFLCGRDLNHCSYTSEHVIPQWAQRRYNLYDQHLTLINHSSIPYRQLTVPCCEDCNKYRLKPIEDSISQTVEIGRESVLSLGHKTIFLWLGKIFYGILYRELMLLHNRANPKLGTIITEQFLQIYKMHRFFLQQARELVELNDFNPGSIFVFDAQALPEKSMEWDLTDNVDTIYICLRVGKVVIYGSLADGGAQQLEEDFYKKYYPIQLHPIQIRELCARFSYRSTCATRTPKYIIAEQGSYKAWQMPLGGFSLKPLFEEFNPKNYAKVLGFYLKCSLDEIFQPPDKVMTWLENENGQLQYMSFDEFPIIPD